MLKTYSKYRKTIMLDPNTGVWVRMQTSLYDKYKDQDEFLDYLIKKYFSSSNNSNADEIDTIYFSITQKCNLSCEFCTMNSNSKVDTSKELDIQVIKEKLPCLLSDKIKKIVITGGEPFENEQLFTILELLSDYVQKEKITLQTNGILLDEDKIARLQNFVGIIEISIENVVLSPVLKEQMQEKFRLINRYKIPLALSYVITADNMKYLKKGLELARDNNTFFSYRIVEPLGGGEKILKNFDVDKAVEDAIRAEIDVLEFILENQLSDTNLTESVKGFLLPKKTCGAFSNILVIHANGKIFPCVNIQSSEFCLGDLKEDSTIELKKLLLDNGKREYVKKYFDVEQKIECQNCFYKYFCNGFCAAHEMGGNGDKTAYKEYVCKIRQVYLDFEMFHNDYKSNFEKYLEEKRLYLLSCIQNGE